MKKGCTLALLISCGLIIIVTALSYRAFEPYYRTVEIPQAIGGKLICDLEYIADHHTWDYIVNYSYKPEDGSIQFIGNGVYSGREWNQNAQLLKMGHWTVLLTGNDRYSDKIIYGDIRTKKWREHELTPQAIERDSLWREKNIENLSPYYMLSKARVVKIENNKIWIAYEYPIKKSKPELTEKKLIEYQLSEEIKMKRISNYYSSLKDKHHSEN